MAGFMPTALKCTSSFSIVGIRGLATSTSLGAEHHYKLLVLGGGSGGCSTAAKFASKLGKGNVAVVEPSDRHYYQPYWTLVGGGVKNFDNSYRPMESVLPSKAVWIKDKAATIQPEENKVVTEKGEVLTYDYMVVAVGLQLRYDMIKGLPEAFDTPGVGSNYSDKYVNKTAKAIEEFKGGNALFTFPASAIKCPGAPQKIMYIASEQFAKRGIQANIEYCSSLPVLFGVKKYADALWKVVEKRGLNITLRHNLIEVKPTTKEAIFENLDTGEIVSKNYDMLHITPPMSPPPVLRSSQSLTDESGYVDVDGETLQHVRFPNVFGIGDCTSVPCSKTAAAVAAQLGVLRKNLQAAMDNQPVGSKYNGYTSCPLVTGSKTCILAEFDFQKPPQPLETFPVNQAKERWTMFVMKANAMPFLYWNLMLRGWWEGPALVRKLLRFGFSK